MAGEQDGSAQRVLRHAVLFGFAFTATDTRAPTSRPPDHVAFADWVGPLVEHVTVVDYWAAADPRRSRRATTARWDGGTPSVGSSPRSAR
jgi:hypothetical protein